MAEYADDGVSDDLRQTAVPENAVRNPQRGINLILIKDLSVWGRIIWKPDAIWNAISRNTACASLRWGDAVDTAHEDIFLPMRNYINERLVRDTRRDSSSLTDEK